MNPSSSFISDLYRFTLSSSHLLISGLTTGALPAASTAVSTLKKDLSVTNPTPPLTTVTEVITPFSMTGVNVAYVPIPDVMISGGALYPVPPLVTIT